MKIGDLVRYTGGSGLSSCLLEEGLIYRVTDLRGTDLVVSGHQASESYQYSPKDFEPVVEDRNVAIRATIEELAGMAGLNERERLSSAFTIWG